MVPPEAAPLMERIRRRRQRLACVSDGDFVEGGAVDIGERPSRCFGELLWRSLLL